jgi:sporulation protein YlmC with PRC-barrel domain
MLLNLSELKGFTLKAKDGEIGEVQDFYFDDEDWAIRYLVVDTGNWLLGRKVLISPISLGKADRGNQRLEVDLAVKQIEDSPGWETSKPVSRQYETSYHDYYGYPYYWTGPYLWGMEAYPGLLATRPPIPPEVEEVKRREQEAADPHMHSANEVLGYYLEATDGDIGHVQEFIVDDENWAIRYMVVDTSNWWIGKKVVVSPQWIERVSWNDSRVYVNMSRDDIKNSPEYDREHPMSRDYETTLYQHYDRQPYWQSTEGQRKRRSDRS